MNTRKATDKRRPRDGGEARRTQLTQHRLQGLEGVLGGVILAPQGAVPEVELQQLLQHPGAGVAGPAHERHGRRVGPRARRPVHPGPRQVVAHPDGAAQVLLVRHHGPGAGARRRDEARGVGGEERPRREEVPEELVPRVVLEAGPEAAEPRGPGVDRGPGGRVPAGKNGSIVHDVVVHVGAQDAEHDNQTINRHRGAAPVNGEVGWQQRSAQFFVAR